MCSNIINIQRRENGVLVDMSLDVLSSARRTGRSPAQTLLSTPTKTPSYTETVRLNQRHLQILTLIGQFHVLTSKQINSLIFHESKSETSCTRALEFLRRPGHDLVRVVEQRDTKIIHGGSGAAVYALTDKGHRLIYRGGKAIRIYARSRRTRHTLAVVDDLIGLMQAERNGTIEIKSWAFEPSYSLDGVEVKPDLDVLLTRWGEEQRYFIETDLGGESASDLRDKFARYKALKAGSGVYREPDGSHTIIEPFPFPEVIFTTEDEYRRDEIRREIDRYPWDESITFRVMTAEDFPRHLL